jgi:hypothetical protein
MSLETDRRNRFRRADDNAIGCPYVTPEQLEAIAENAAERAVKKMTDNLYKEVGKGVLNKLLWVLGIITVAMAAWLHDRGYL